MLAPAGCAETESSFGLGLGLQLRVADAQLMNGALPPASGGPNVTQVLRPQTEVQRGEATVQLGGRLGAGGVALLVHAAGDPQHWLVAPDGFDFVVADELLWATQLEFSHALPGPDVDLELMAVDRAGNVGDRSTVRFTIGDDRPVAELLVSLAWDAPVDLDLHVELPDGTIVGPKNVNAFEPIPGMPPAADGTQLGGYHEFDSNQQCRIDARNREDVVWEVPPTPGRYRIYAELFSACDAAAVNLQALALRGDDRLAEASATLQAFDAREHAREGDAPGLLLVEFEVE